MKKNLSFAGLILIALAMGMLLADVVEANPNRSDAEHHNKNITSLPDPAGQLIREERPIPRIQEAVFGVLDAETGEVSYLEWEDYYFNQDDYLKKLEEAVAARRHLGNLWWKVQFRTEFVEDEGQRGALYFVVDYPIYQFSEPLWYKMVKAEDGSLIIRNHGEFKPKRDNNWFGPCVAQSLIYLFVGLGCFFVGKFFLKILDFISGIIAEGVFGKKGMSVWARRFWMCVIGLIIITVIVVRGLLG